MQSTFRCYLAELKGHSTHTVHPINVQSSSFTWKCDEFIKQTTGLCAPNEVRQSDAFPRTNERNVDDLCAVNKVIFCESHLKKPSSITHGYIAENSSVYSYGDVPRAVNFQTVAITTSEHQRFI